MPKKPQDNILYRCLVLRPFDHQGSRQIPGDLILLDGLTCANCVVLGLVETLSEGPKVTEKVGE